MHSLRTPVIAFNVNKLFILEAIDSQNIISQSMIANRLGISTAAVNVHINALQDEGLVLRERINGRDLRYRLTSAGSDCLLCQKKTHYMRIEARLQMVRNYFDLKIKQILQIVEAPVRTGFFHNNLISYLFFGVNSPGIHFIALFSENEEEYRAKYFGHVILPLMYFDSYNIQAVFNFNPEPFNWKIDNNIIVINVYEELWDILLK